MAEQIRNTGGPADGATVTENDLILQVKAIPPHVNGAVGGVVLSVGFTQMKVDILIDPDKAEWLVGELLRFAVEARTMPSQILRL